MSYDTPDTLMIRNTNYMREEAMSNLESVESWESEDLDELVVAELAARRMMLEELALIGLFPEFCRTFSDMIVLADVKIMQRRELLENARRVMSTLVILGRIELVARRMPLVLEVVSSSGFC